MAKKEVKTIDALFGSKTRVKLLHLFLNNPDKSFYVREITRLIDEQINSVRRELSNMMNVGVVANDTEDNKLYYRVNKSYEFYEPFREIFAPKQAKSKTKSSSTTDTKLASSAWVKQITDLESIRVAVTAGILVNGSASNIDVLLVGSVSKPKAAQLVEAIERSEGRDINYTSMSYDEFYYRLSVRDKFVMEILSSRHNVLVDRDNVLAQYS